MKERSRARAVRAWARALPSTRPLPRPPTSGGVARTAPGGIASCCAPGFPQRLPADHLDSNPVSAFQERIGFNLHAARNALAHGLDLRVGNDCGHACESHQAQDAGRGQDPDLLLEFLSQEDVAGKQGCRKFPGSITPLANRGVLRQEYFKSFVGKRTRRQALMLVPGVDRQPTRCSCREFSSGLSSPVNI